MVRDMDGGMSLGEAALWGLAGGAVAALVSLAAEVVANRFRWPWRNNKDGIWPRVFVGIVGLIAGAIVAGAAHKQINNEWPALIMGASAPSVIRGAISRIEVAERKSDEGGPDGRA